MTFPQRSKAIVLYPMNALATDQERRFAHVIWNTPKLRAAGIRVGNYTGQYHVWNLTWDDFEAGKSDDVMVCHTPVVDMLVKRAQAARQQAQDVPAANRIVGNGLEQLKAFINTPHAAGWLQLASFAVFFPLQMLMTKRTVAVRELREGLDAWRAEDAMPALSGVENGDWVYNDRATLNQDVMAYITVADAVSQRQSQTLVLARLDDRDTVVESSEFRERWHRFLAVLNLFQFCSHFQFWTRSEAERGEAPEIALEAAAEMDEAWQAVLEDVMPSLSSVIYDLAAAGLPVPEGVPEVEYYHDDIDDEAFAELAWPRCQPPIAILAGEQIEFARQWQEQGWRVITPDDIQAKGISHVIDQLVKGIAGA